MRLMLRGGTVLAIGLVSASFTGEGVYSPLRLPQQFRLTRQQPPQRTRPLRPPRPHPPEALRSATRAGPDWFGQLDLYGSITPGKTADLVLLTRNPLEDITATRAIEAVVLRGRTFDRATLDAILAKTRAQVAKWNAEAAR